MSSPSIATSRRLARGVPRTQRSITGCVRSEEGFSILELMIVVALLIIATTIALYMVQNVVRSVHLQQSSANYANLLQQARVRAVQDDRYYSVITVPATSTALAEAYVDLDGSQTYTPGEPMMVLGSGVDPMDSSSAPAVNALKAVFLPSGTQYTVNTTAPGPTFGPRGIPCGPTTASGYTTCPSTAPTSFMTFLKNNRSQDWEAITVTPAGRIHLWSYSASGGWSPMN